MLACCLLSFATAGVAAGERMSDMPVGDLLRLHGGLGALGPGTVVRSGSLAPHLSPVATIQSAARRSLPHPALLRSADGRTLTDAFAVAERETTSQALLAMASARQAQRSLEEICGIAETALTTSCFPVGTLVVLADGTTRPIETIRVGEQVRSRPESSPTAEWAPGQVARTFTRRAAGLVHLDLMDAQGGVHRLRLTAEHPLHVSGGGGWRPAGALVPGQRLLGGDRTWLISAVTPQPGAVDVYNLEVAQTHTYVVALPGADAASPAQVWVHNTCTPLSLARDLTLRLIRDGELLTKEAADVFIIRTQQAIARRAGGGLAGLRASIGLVPNNSAALKQELLRVTGYKPLYDAAAHHLMPTKVVEAFTDFLRSIGYKHNHAGNGMWLPAEQLDAVLEGFVRHAGNHPGYSTVIEEKLFLIKEEYIVLAKNAIGNEAALQRIQDWARNNVLHIQDQCRMALSDPAGKIVIRLNDTSTLLIEAHYRDVVLGNIPLPQPVLLP